MIIFLLTTSWTDLAVLYHQCMQAAGLNLTHLRDTVHLMRQLVRLFNEAIRDVTLDVPKGLPLKARKQQLHLKRRLLRQYLQPLLALALKAFSPGYESVSVLILESTVSQLQDPARIIQTASVQTLARRLQRLASSSMPCLYVAVNQRRCPTRKICKVNLARRGGRRRVGVNFRPY
jgi:hypothetical protein